MEEKDSASVGRVGVPSLQLLFELAVKDLIALVFSLLLGMELQCFLESLVNQKAFVQHLKIKPCHMQLASLERGGGRDGIEKGGEREESERDRNRERS